MDHSPQRWSEVFFFHLPKCLLLSLVFSYIYISFFYWPMVYYFISSVLVTMAIISRDGLRQFSLIFSV